MRAPQILVRTRHFIGSSSRSFSFLRRNFFAFGLEITLALVALLSVAVNVSNLNPAPRSAGNRYLGLLLAYPDTNPNLIAEMKTQKIQISPEKQRYISTAQASPPPLLAHGGSSAEDASKSRDSLPMMSPDGVLQKPNYTSKDAFQNRDIEEYTVKGGDSLARIASVYGVSVQTILYENKLNVADYIKPGQHLKILPTDGISHTVQKNETIESIAKKYKVDPEAILDFNEIEVPEDIQQGEILIIPNGQAEVLPSAKPKLDSLKKVDVKTANVPDDYAGSGGALLWQLATHNITQYYSSRHRALDVSNGQRPQFWAAQDGIVELSGWQSGYGNTAVINHGNGLKTRYAHASELYVSAGDKVAKGQMLGRVGNTGRTYGATGNHLHFEVIKNGTKYDPLKFF